MPKMIVLMLIGMILIPTLQAVEDERVVKLLLCYNSPNSDYCLAEYILKLKQQVDEMKRQNNTLQGTIQSLKGEVAHLKSQQSENNKHILVLETKTQAHKKIIEVQQETLQSLKGEVAQLKSQQSENNKHILVLETKTQAHKKIIEVQQETLQSLKGEVAQLKSQLSENNKRIMDLETRSQTQQKTIDTQQKNLQDFWSKISRLESRLYRYIDNNNGTITDSRTQLIWLKKANCFGRQDWKTAMQKVAKLATGQCGLRDGSEAGDWRLPTRKEWEAMMDLKYRRLTLSDALGTGQWKEGDAFLGVQLSKYWSSNLHTDQISSAWYVNIYNGQLDINKISTNNYVWAIRGVE
ncbi:MAG: DUF1566 domain-containing protein [Thiomargarita sp.]|nr:DUF1566 domain-containing protein [Thiomargarita sp.]